MNDTYWINLWAKIQIIGGACAVAFTIVCLLVLAYHKWKESK